MASPSGTAGRLALILGLVLAAGACGPAGERRPAVPRDIDLAASTVLRTAGELRGRAVYEREHCARCHTLLGVPPPHGPVSLPAPATTFPSRVGPDLGSEGHRRSDDWHYAHLYAPSIVMPGSPMPASRHLFRPGRDGRPVPSIEAVDLVAYLQALGRGKRDIWAEFRRREPEIAAFPSGDAGLLTRGAALYREQCAACHGETGKGSGPAAPLLLFPPRDFTAGHFRFKSTPAGEPPSGADLFRTITIGTGIGSAMPGFYWLPARDRWALVRRIEEFSPRLRGAGSPARGGPASSRPVPEAVLPAGDGPVPIGRGRGLWVDLACASCHGEGGTGRSREEAGASWSDPEGIPVPRSGSLAHACALRGGADPGALDRAIFGDGLAMPSYSEAVRDAQDRRALLDYVLSLQDGPESR